VKKLTSEQELMVATVRQFVDKEVIPVASAMEHRNEYPHALVEQMRTMGLFGLNVPEEYGGAEIDFTTFAMIFEELSRGWLGLAGVIGTHSVLCDVLIRFGTEEQKRRFLPGLASGERRGGICLSEPGAGTDLQNISTMAVRAGDVYRITGSKMWVTNGRYGNTFLLLARNWAAHGTAPSRNECVRDRKGRAGVDGEPRHRQVGVQERRNL
jgi:alkylation response protein AidB-like acyl-CoA dehydrogenase